MKTSKKQSAWIIICGALLLLFPAAFAGNVTKFKFLDTDNDGRISRSEHAAGAMLMFDRLDADGDGVLTVAEMEACRQLKSTTNSGDKREEKPTDDKIAMIDAYTDGRLTRAENEAAADKMFTQLDTDKDGYLGLKECEACRALGKKDK